MEPIVSFVTTYALLAKSQFLLAAAWVESQAVLVATSFAGATLGVQLAIAAAALLAVILISFSAYRLYTFSKKPGNGGGEEEPDVPEPEEPEISEPEDREVPKPKAPEPKPQQIETIEDPDNFCSPIGNLELMTDPVIASDGQTYERADIEEYFQDGKNNLSPMIGVEFKNHELIPNRKLKAEIDGYLALKNQGAPAAQITAYLASLKKVSPLFAPPQGAAPAASEVKIYDAADDSDIEEDDEIKPPPPPVYESEYEESEAEPDDDFQPPVFNLVDSDDDDLFGDQNDDNLFAFPSSPKKKG